MILYEELKRVVLKQQEDLEFDPGLPRDQKINTQPKFATIISGIRRGGKSTLARQILQQKRRVLYTCFEDINLAAFEFEDFIRLEKVFSEEFGSGGIFFFDEIQNIEGWERYVRQLVDKGSEVLVTGSNAKMLSRELGTKLTGRQITKELYPFSYREFLRLRAADHSIVLFREFLKEGGFPEYLKTGNKEILRNLFQDIVYRDILQRNDLRNETAIKNLLQYLLANIGKQTSYNRLRSLINVGSVNSVSQFIDYFEQAYLLFPIKKFDYSVKKQLVNPKKIYCVDNGIIGQNAFSFSENRGRLLENAVFIELKRREYEIFYHSDQQECDFMLRKGTRIVEAIQVCYEITNDNRQREINGLLEALITYDLKEGLFLTFDQEESFYLSGRTIKMIPVWRWLLTG